MDTGYCEDMSNSTATLAHADTITPITSQARGLGEWTLTTANGDALGVIARRERIAPNGRRFTQAGYMAEGRFVACSSIDTAVFVLAHRVLEPSGDPIDQQVYFRFIDGARLVKVG